MTRRAALPLAALLLCALLSGCGRVEKYEQARYDLFDTVCRVSAYAESEDAFLRLTEPMWRRLEEIDRALDPYHGYEGLHNLYYVNLHAAEAPVRAEDVLFDMLLWYRDNRLETGETVNIAMGAVLNLWHDAREAGGPPPSEEVLRAAALHTDFGDVILDEAARTVFFADPLLKLDPGAVGKGYAAREALKALGEGAVLVNLGGIVACAGAPDGRDFWRVAVQSPFSASDSLGILRVKDESVVTSAVYQRFFEWDGARYHHLIDPETLIPGNFYSSVTVVCKDPAAADLLSTRLFLLPIEESRAAAESAGADALWVLPNGETLMTDGFRRRLEE